jgi:Ca2+/Na+ antiporter
MSPIAKDSTNPITRLVAVYYVLTIALGAFVLLFHGRLAFAVDLVAVVFYLALTAFVYDFSKRVPQRHGPVRRN